MAGNYAHDSGTTDPKTVTVPDGKRVKRYACFAGGSGGTVVITPYSGTVQSTITVPASQPFSDDFTTDTTDLDCVELPGKSTITFAGMATWFVRFT